MHCSSYILVMIPPMSSKLAAKTSSKLANYMAIVILVVLLLLPLHAFFTTWAASNFGYADQLKAWKEVIILFLTIGCTWLLVAQKNLRQKFLRSRLTILIGLFTLLGLLRTAYGLEQNIINPEAAAYGVLGAFRYFLFFLVIWLVASKTEMLQRWWPFAVITPATIVVMFGLLQQFVLDKNFLAHFGYGQDTIPAFQSVDQKTEYARAQSTLRGPNPLGAYLALVITAITGMFYKFKSYRFSFGFLLAAATVLLYFSYSRSAWAGLTISLAVWTMLVIKNKKVLNYLVIAGLLGVVVGVGSVYALRNNDYIQNTVFHTDENSVSATSTNDVRTQALQDGVKDIWENPLGQGLGSAGPASMRTDHPKIAENYYVQVAQEIGIVGLALYLAITFGVGVELWRRRDQLLPQILFASLIGITAINMVSHAWMDDTLSLMWWGLAGIAVASPVIISHKHEKQTKSEKAQS